MSGSRSASALPATAKRLQVGPLHKIHQNTTQLPPLVSSHLPLLVLVLVLLSALKFSWGIQEQSGANLRHFETAGREPHPGRRIQLPVGWVKAVLNAWIASARVGDQSQAVMLCWCAGRSDRWTLPRRCRAIPIKVVEVYDEASCSAYITLEGERA